MDTIKNQLLALHNDEDGATATEYIILLVLVACFVIAIIALFGEEIEELFSEAQEEVEQVGIDGYEGDSGQR